MGGGIGGGLGYVLGNRLKNPTALVHDILPPFTFTRRAFMSFNVGLFGVYGVLLTGIKVIRDFHWGSTNGRSERYLEKS